MVQLRPISRRKSHAWTSLLDAVSRGSTPCPGHSVEIPGSRPRAPRPGWVHRPITSPWPVSARSPGCTVLSPAPGPVSVQSPLAAPTGTLPQHMPTRTASRRGYPDVVSRIAPAGWILQSAPRDPTESLRRPVVSELAVTLPLGPTEGLGRRVDAYLCRIQSPRLDGWRLCLGAPV